MTQIVTIRLLISNAYLVRADRPVLVDAGSPREEHKIVRALRRAGVEPRDLGLIVLTHGHSDHAGSAAALRRISGAPLAIHAHDAHMLRRGSNDPLVPTNLAGRMMRPFTDRRFEPCEPDLLLEGERSLAEYGLPGRVLCTPGHTPGSLSLLLDHHEAIAGDLLIGGYLGGLVARGVPRYPYFADDLPEIVRSVERLLATRPTRIYVGHGGPLEAPHVEQWLAAQPQPALAPEAA